MQSLRGIIYKLIAVMFFIAMASLIKAASVEVPPGEAVFFRSLFAVPVIIIWLTSQGKLRSGLKTTRPLAHAWRGIIGTMAMGFGFTGLGLLPLPEVTAIGYASPLLVVVLAAVFLGEKIRLFRISAVLLGLVGVLIILSPRLDGLGELGNERESLGAILVLCGAFCSALAQLQIRRLVHVESTATIVFYFSVTSTLLTLFTLPFGWVLPSAAVIGMLVLSGILGGFGQIFVTSAFRFADVSVIAPFDYASMIFALLIGYFVFGEVPNRVVLAGAVLVIFAGVLIIWREHLLGLERGKARARMSP